MLRNILKTNKQNSMATSKAALCKALLQGKTVNIKNGFEWFGITNIPREVGRSIERSFGVSVHRTPMEGKSRYGQSCVWVNYKLLRSKENEIGIQKMIEYVKAQTSNNPRTEKEKTESVNTSELHKFFTPQNNLSQQTLFNPATQ